MKEGKKKKKSGRGRAFSKQLQCAREVKKEKKKSGKGPAAAAGNRTKERDSVSPCGESRTRVWRSGAGEVAAHEKVVRKKRKKKKRCNRKHPPV